MTSLCQAVKRMYLGKRKENKIRMINDHFRQYLKIYYSFFYCIFVNVNVITHKLQSRCNEIQLSIIGIPTLTHRMKLALMILN